MWGRWVLLALYLLLTYVSIKDAIDMYKNEFEWYTKMWLLTTLAVLITLIIKYF